MCITGASTCGGLFGLLLFLWQVQKGGGCRLTISASGLALTNTEVCMEVKSHCQNSSFCKELFQRGVRSG